MRLIFASILACFVFVTSNVIFCAEEKWSVMAENMPPFNFSIEGKVCGISTDLFVKAMERAGSTIDPADIKIYPWARAYEMVLDEPATMLYSVARIEPREKLFKWAGPIVPCVVGLIAPKAKKIVLHDIKDAEKLRIGSIRNGAPEQLLIKMGIREELLDRAGTVQQNVEKLRADRIDLFAFNIPTTVYVMRQMGMKPEEYEVVYILAETNLCYAFHKSTDQKFIDRLNQAINDLKTPDQTGKSVFDGIVASYLGEGGMESIQFNSEKSPVVK